ncbi:MAG: hypothetical protein ACTSRG_04465 [Candidatus Helarchaeota archaeon]
MVDECPEVEIMELPGFGYKMKEFLGLFKGELIEYRIRIDRSKDVKTKDPKTKAKVVVGNRFKIEKDKMKMIVQATKEKDYLKVILAPEKPDKYISDEFFDITVNCLQQAREALIKRDEREDFEDIVLTKLSQSLDGVAEGPKALTCVKCKAPLPPTRRGNVVCPYCNTTNVI